jgi:hypothetical protein
MDMTDAARTRSRTLSRSPPRLQLDLPAAPGSFKRTFEELGFDLVDNEDNNTAEMAGGSRAALLSASAPPSSDEDNNAPGPSRLRNKRARSEESDLASAASASTSTSPTANNPSTGNTSIHLSPIEGVSPIMASLPWDPPSPSLLPLPPSAGLVIDDTEDNSDEDVQMVDAPPDERLTHSANLSPHPPSTRPAPPPLLQIGPMGSIAATEPFASSPLRQSFHPEDRLEDDLVSEGGSSSFTLLQHPGSTSNTPSQHTLGLPEQDFFPRGSLRSETPPWLRTSGLPVLPMPTLPSSRLGFDSTDSLVSTDDRPGPSTGYNSDLSRNNRDLPSFPPTLSLDSPGPSFLPPISLHNHSPRQPFLRRSSSLLSLRASPSLALDEGTALAGHRHPRNESPLFPAPPAPRAGVSYRFDEDRGEWVGRPTLPTPSPIRATFANGGAGPGGAGVPPPRARLGEFLELAPSPEATWRFSHGRGFASPDEMLESPAVSTANGSGPGDEDWNDSSWGQLGMLNFDFGLDSVDET